MCSLTKKKINEAATYKQACTLVILILIITHICFSFFDIEIMTIFRQNIRHPGYFLIDVAFFYVVLVKELHWYAAVGLFL